MDKRFTQKEAAPSSLFIGDDMEILFVAYQYVRGDFEEYGGAQEELNGWYLFSCFQFADIPMGRKPHQASQLLEGDAARHPK